MRLGQPTLPAPTPEPVYEPPILPPSVDTFTAGDDDEDMVSRSTSLIPSPPRKIRGEDVMFRYTAELRRVLFYLYSSGESNGESNLCFYFGGCAGSLIGFSAVCCHANYTVARYENK